MVISCVTLTSHDLLQCVVLSEGGLSKLCSLELGSSLCIWRDLSFSSLFWGNMVRVACFVDTISHAYGTLLSSANDNFSESKLILVAVLTKKSIPSSTSSSVGRGHTKNVWLNFLLPKINETCCCPFMSRASPVTPWGFMAMTFMSLLDTRLNYRNIRTCIYYYSFQFFCFQ